MLTGSARLNQENRERAEQQRGLEEMERKRLALEQRRKAVEAQIESLRAGMLAEQEEFNRMAASSRLRQKQTELDRQALSLSRKVANRNGFKR